MRGLCMLVALGLSFAWYSPAAQAEDMGPQLIGDDIVKAIADRQVDAVSPKGNKWGAVYKSDGSVAYSSGEAGTWRVDGEKFCDFPDGDKEYCSTVFGLGGNKYQLLRADGSKGSVLTIK